MKLGPCPSDQDRHRYAGTDRGNDNMGYRTHPHTSAEDSCRWQLIHSCYPSDIYNSQSCYLRSRGHFQRDKASSDCPPTSHSPRYPEYLFLLFASHAWTHLLLCSSSRRMRSSVRLRSHLSKKSDIQRNGENDICRPGNGYWLLSFPYA